MKKLLVIISIISLLFEANAQVPNGINYQAVVRDDNGKVVANEKVSISISFQKTIAIDANLIEPVMTQEFYDVQTNSNGVINIVIGESGNFDIIDWSKGPYFIVVLIDIKNGSDFKFAGSSQLLSVPYAKFAEKAANVITTDQIISLIDSLFDTNAKAQIKHIVDSVNKKEEQEEKKTENVKSTVLLESTSGKLFKMSVSDEGTVNTNEVVLDADGNPYDFVKIGDYTWLAQNLKTTHFNNGDSIPLITDTAIWNSLSIPANAYLSNYLDVYKQFGEENDYKWDSDNDSNYIEVYGLLYNWYVINDERGVCPTGWHVSTQQEWDNLISTAGSGVNDVACKNLKSKIYWWAKDPQVTNSTGFNALAGGRMPGDNAGFKVAYSGSWWTSTLSDTSSSRSISYTMRTGRTLSSSFSSTIQSWDDLQNLGFSIRCVKNQ